MKLLDMNLPGYNVILISVVVILLIYLGFTKIYKNQ